MGAPGPSIYRICCDFGKDLIIFKHGAISSVVERHIDIVKAAGPIPASRTQRPTGVFVGLYRNKRFDIGPALGENMNHVSYSTPRLGL